MQAWGPEGGSRVQRVFVCARGPQAGPGSGAGVSRAESKEASGVCRGVQLVTLGMGPKLR